MLCVWWFGVGEGRGSVLESLDDGCLVSRTRIFLGGGCFKLFPEGSLYSPIKKFFCFCLFPTTPGYNKLHLIRLLLH